MRILITGDSLTLPRLDDMRSININSNLLFSVHFEETYGHLLEETLKQCYHDQNIHVINRGQKTFTIKDVADALGDHLFIFEPNIIIMHVGIVD